jgi:dihydroxyacid dehydratase/phosphogluconate dehydratase
VFTSEPEAIAAIKDGRIRPGDVLVLMGRGPMGAGMEEIYQITAALKYLEFGKHVAVLTDARFSGVSTGACIGHISTEALAGGPLGKLQDGDLIEILIDRNRLEGSVNLVGANGALFGAEEGARVLASRPTPRCPRTRVCGPRSRKSAAAPEAARSSTTRRSCARWMPARRRWLADQAALRT